MIGEEWVMDDARWRRHPVEGSAQRHLPSTRVTERTYPVMARVRLHAQTWHIPSARHWHPTQWPCRQLAINEHRTVGCRGLHPGENREELKGSYTKVNDELDTVRRRMKVVSTWEWVR